MMATRINSAARDVNYTIIPPGPYEEFFRLLNNERYRPIEHSEVIEQMGQRVVCPCCGSTAPKHVEHWTATMTNHVRYGFAASIAQCPDCQNTTMFNLDSEALTPMYWRPA